MTNEIDKFDVMQKNWVFDQKHNCIQEERAYCDDACPAHVGVRTIMSYMKDRKVDNAFAEYQKKVLLPGIISRICDQPCTKACIRNRLDRSLEIRKIEKACVDYASNTVFAKKYIRPQQQTVSVIGAGLTGIACSALLGQKGYKVKLYEKSERPGGRLWDYSRDVLPEKIIREEIAALLEWGRVELYLNQPQEDVTRIATDAIFLATGDQTETLGVDILNVDSVTLQTKIEVCFAGGNILSENGSLSPIECIAQAKKAAKYIERYLKKTPLIFGNEAETKTKLFTPLTNVLPRLNSKIDHDFSLEEAVTEAKACIECECLACVAPCKFLRDGKQYPKRYIVEAQQSLRTIIGQQNKLAARRTNTCNMCGLCKEMCPNDVDMSEVYLYSKRIMHELDELPPAFHTFWLNDMDFHTKEIALSKNQPGQNIAKYLFFPGCQLGGSDPSYVYNTYRYLMEHLPGGVALDTNCCGAPSEWAGYTEVTEPLLKKFDQTWENFGHPTVILACPTCGKMMKKYHPQTKTISLWEILKSIPLPQNTAAVPKDAAIFDPCASRYNSQAQQAVRYVVGNLGININELPYHGLYAQCCGYGGLIYAADPKTAIGVTEERAAQSDLPYITYCANCRDTLRRVGKPTWHILDLLFGNDTDPLHIISLSDRRNNRKLMKEQLLHNVWQEQGDIKMREYDAIKVLIGEDLQKKLDRELILADDIRRVIYNAEVSKEKIGCGKNFISHLQIGYITYWVEYCSCGDTFQVLNAYSHRMQIGEEKHD